MYVHNIQTGALKFCRINIIAAEIFLTHLCKSVSDSQSLPEKHEYEHLEERPIYEYSWLPTAMEATTLSK